MELNKNKLFFILGSIVFLGISWFVSLFLVVGAGFGALGMFFVMGWYQPFYQGYKKRKIAKLYSQLHKLETS